MANLDFLSGQVLRDMTGAPYLSAKAYYWADSGASTPLATYSDAGLTSANTNPVVADGTTGAFGPIYLKASRYWRTVKTSAGVALTQFNLGPIEIAPGWVTSLTAPSPTYPFLFWYDTTTGHLKRRASDDLSWIDLGAVDSLINAATVAQQITGTSTTVASTPASVGALWLAGTAVSISANNISLPSTGGGVFTCGTATTTLTTISSTTEGRIIRLILTNAQTVTHGSGINVPGALTTKLPAGCELTLRRGSSDWTITDWTTGPVPAPERATNVVVTKTGGATIAITADYAFCRSTAGLSYRHSGVSVSINLATTGANALDTGAQGTDWYSLWLISDGTTVAGLASASFTAPTMPSGYTYKVRVGAMHSTSTTLDGSKSYGNRSYYTGGAQSVTSTNSQSNASTSLATLVPDTAIAGIFNATTASNANSGVGVSPNTSYGTTFGNATSANTPYVSCTSIASTENGNFTAEVPIETAQTVYVTTGTAGTNRLNIVGWIDNAPVN